MLRDRLAGAPGRARHAPRAARPGRLDAVRAARHARRLGPPARPLAFPDAALGCAETTAARCARTRARRSASCATSTTSTTSSARARCRSASVQALPVPGPRRDRRRRAGGPARRRPHGGRHGRLDPVGPGARLRRLPVAGRDPVAERARRAATPTWPRSSACAPYVERGGVGRARPRPADRRAARAGHPARGRGVPARPARPATRRCRWPAARPRQRKIHEENLEPRRRWRVTLQHVSLETRREDAEREVAFWALLGFAAVAPPPGAARRRHVGEPPRHPDPPALRRRPGRHAAAGTSPSSSTTMRRPRRRSRPPASRSSRARRTGTRRAPSCARRPATASRSWPRPRRADHRASPLGTMPRAWPRTSSAITGATGGLGGRVAARLADAGRRAAPHRPRPARAPGATAAPRSSRSPATTTASRCAAPSTASTRCCSSRPPRTPSDRVAAPHGDRCRRRGRASGGSSTRRSWAPRPDATFTFARDHFHAEALHPRARTSSTRSCATASTSTSCRCCAAPTA